MMMQGDILAGTLGTLLHWSTLRKEFLPSKTEIEKIIKIATYNHKTGKDWKKNSPFCLIPAYEDRDISEDEVEVEVENSLKLSGERANWGMKEITLEKSEIEEIVEEGKKEKKRRKDIDKNVDENEEEIVEEEEDNILVWCGIMASTITRGASRQAFAVHKRAMNSPNVMDKLAESFENIDKYN